MSEALEYCRRCQESLKAWNNEGSARAPIPSALDSSVSDVVMRFVQSASPLRHDIASVFSDDHSFTFIGFARRMAALAVRKGSKEILLQGLAALVLDGGKFDVRENISVMAPLYDAALKIGADPVEVFARTADLAENEVADALRDFPNRPDDLKSLIAMNFVESEDQDGFVYEKVL